MESTIEMNVSEEMLPLAKEDVENLTKAYGEKTLAELRQAAQYSRINTEGDKDALVNRLVRRDLRKTYGDDAVQWLPIDDPPKQTCSKDDIYTSKLDETVQINDSKNIKNSTRYSVGFKSPLNDTLFTNQSFLDLNNSTIQQKDHNTEQDTLNPLAASFAPPSIPANTQPSPRLQNLFLQYNVIVEQINETLRQQSLPEAAEKISIEDRSTVTSSNRQEIDITCKTQQVLRNYDLKLGKNDKVDAESFIAKLHTVQTLTKITDKDLLRFMPSMLVGDAEIWAEPA
ncbi:hypothetical protein TKK_0013917 [Trichogramma kaykai]|uniref:SAP domain-containing protein n=1 Tax=Trichogramma kaykai TaxID=54128 RepID=A0ABD2WFF2_9HYME